MGKACIHQMILQWTVDSKNRTTVYPSGLAGYTQSSTHDVVERALRSADDTGDQIYLGLQINDDWFIKFANDGPWLRNEAQVANAIGEDLWRRYGNHPSLAGWYLGFEVDNHNETTLVAWNRLAQFYETVGHHLHGLTPGKPVLIAPFFAPAGGLTAFQFRRMWEHILARSPLDILALQDSVGAGNTTLKQLPSWFRAVHSAIRHARPNMQFWADTETFNLNFQPMSIRSVVQDMGAVKSEVTNYLSFSFNHYISSQQVNSAYYDTYLDYLTTGAVENIRPSTPVEVDVESINSVTLGLSWRAATDNEGVVGYKILRDGLVVARLYGNPRSFTDQQLNPGTTYSYHLVAFDAAGNESLRSTAATAKTPPDPYKTNLANHKPYTTILAADPAYPDTGGLELTDGILGAPNFTVPAWQGRNTPSAYSFLIDLGGEQSIKEIRSGWLQVQSAGILLPLQVSYAVSGDARTFHHVGTVNQPFIDSSDQVRWNTLTDLRGVSARYVRVEVTPSSSVWTFVDEVEVRQ